MHFRTFVALVQEGREVDMSVLQRIVGSMSAGRYDDVVKLFGVNVGRRPSDDDSANVEDLPVFRHETTAPANDAASSGRCDKGCQSR
jgi:hypothetical protein